jgi:hypothetical protein
MNRELIERLSVITDEERQILSGPGQIDRTLYTEQSQLIIDSRKMLDQGKLIQIRPHTRFVHFPRHRHNYVEIIYMCSGSTTHIINGIENDLMKEDVLAYQRQTTHIIDNNQVLLREGELLFLNQNAVQEILPAGREDIAVNFIILPEFFDTTFRMMGEDENILRDFLVDCLRQENSYGRYLHFKVADLLPAQNLVENMVWTLLNNQPSKRSINQFTMGLLLLQLVHHTDRLDTGAGDFDQQLIFKVLRYIDEHYRDGQLTQLAAALGFDVSWLSRAVKRLLGRTYKELLQIKRLNQAAFLLQSCTCLESSASVLGML